MIYRCSCNDLFEIICLYNYIDIDKLPDINMNSLKKYLSNIYNQSDVDEHINAILYNSIIENILKIRTKHYLINNPEDIFEYLYFTTKSDIIMTYLNKEYLLKLLDYCNNITFNNNYIRADIKRLVKSKLEN